jgi:hypothetical protein
VRKTRGCSEKRHNLYCFLSSNMSRTVRWAASVVSMSKKAVPLQAWSGPEDLQEVKFPIFHDNGTR